MESSSYQVNHQFDFWLSDVRRYVINKTGIDIDDLPDQPYRDWFDEGLEFDMAGELVIERELAT